MGGRGSGGGATGTQILDIRDDNAIRAGYRELAQPGEWVGMADLREASDLSRKDFDETIRRIARGDYDGPGGAFATEETNQKTLTSRDRAAAVFTTGGGRIDVIKFDNPAARPLPKKK